MLRPFQVNVGQYLNLGQDILPTARVAELCSAIQSVSGEKRDTQVLLTADGKQMDPRDLIGNYSVGTDDKPIFIFYQSYLSANEPPVVLSRIPQRSGTLQKQMEMIKQKPSPVLFQHQVALAKRLCEYTLEVGQLCGELSEEYCLQNAGWETVLSNCGTIIGMFQKHHQLFSKAVEKFREDKAHFVELLDQFPQEVALLQQLPLPSAPLQESTSLYDWISTHDEKNSLMDLSTECQKALAKVDGQQLEKVLQSSGKIMETWDLINSTQEKRATTQEVVESESKEIKDIMETVTGLNKNIQMTSDKALRSGDGRTIAVLVESHHNSLQLMATSSSRLQTIARRAEESKAKLTSHIHCQLKQVTELQRKVAESNSQLVLLHEHIKLARKRFEILEQVCSTPHVLKDILSEVRRRRSYNAALEKVMSQTGSRLQRAREEEKKLRKLFQSSHGQHFVTTLFPELQDRVPEITFHAPKSLTKTYEDDLGTLQTLLPQDSGPLAQMAISVQILSQGLFDSAETVTRSGENRSDSGDSMRLISSQTSSPSKSYVSEGQRDMEELKELVGKLELSNMDLTSKLHQGFQSKEALEASVAEKESAYLSAAKRLEESERQVSSLMQRLAQLEAREQELVRERLLCTETMEELEQRNSESAEKLAHAYEDMQELTRSKEEAIVQCNQLIVEKEKAQSKITALDCHCKQLETEHAQIRGRLEQECSRLQVELKQVELLQEEKATSLETQLSDTQSENHQLMESNNKLSLKVSTMEARLLEDQEKWELKLQQLEGELARYQEEEQRVQKETLREHSRISGELAMMRNKLQEKERSLELSLAELNLVKRGSEGTHDEIERLRGELARERQRCIQAQATMNTNRAQAEAVEARRKELERKLSEKTAEQRDLVAELEDTRRLLSVRESELVHAQREHESEVKDLKEKKRTESEKAAGAAKKCIQELENKLSQAEARAASLSGKLESAETKIDEQERELAEIKGELLASNVKLDHELVLRKEIEVVKREDLEGKLQETKAKLEKVLREFEDSKKEWSTERDEYLKKEMIVSREFQERKKEWSIEKDEYIKNIMELEREVKELHRETLPVVSVPQKKQPSHRMSSSTTALDSSSSRASSSSATNIIQRVSLHSLQAGNLALFMSDQYGNYLALTLDEQTYFLEPACVPSLQDFALIMPQLKLQRQLLLGKITKRWFMEVRKEGNRLRVPVGSRLFKVAAEEVHKT